MPRPCPKRVRQLKQHTPNCKTSFPIYFFLRRPSWHLDRSIFHCSLGRRKPSAWYLDGIIFHCSLGRRKPAKEKNGQHCFAIWCRTRHVGASTCRFPAPQCSCSSSPIWQTRHAGTSTCHVPAPRCSGSSSPISGELATLEPSPALAFIKLINAEGWMSKAKC